MKNENELRTSTSPEPFEIIYNFRHKKHQHIKPRRKASACERHKPIPEFTIRTRKMTAEIELKHQLLSEQLLEKEEEIRECPEAPLNGQDEELQFFLKNQDYLENGIPLSSGPSNDLQYQLAENSQFSTYSKLEKALFGFNLECSMEEE